jgi:hypothetical protein
MFQFYSTWITRMYRIENENGKNGKQMAMAEAEAIFGTPDFAPFRKRGWHPGRPVVHPESTGTPSRRGFLVRIRGNADSGLPGMG